MAPPHPQVSPPERRKPSQFPQCWFRRVAVDAALGGGGCWEDKGAAGAGGEGGGRRRESSRPASRRQAPPRRASRDPGDLTPRVEGGGCGGGAAPPRPRPRMLSPGSPPASFTHRTPSSLPPSGPPRGISPPPQPVSFPGNVKDFSAAHSGDRPTAPQWDVGGLEPHTPRGSSMRPRGSNSLENLARPREVPSGWGGGITAHPVAGTAGRFLPREAAWPTPAPARAAWGFPVPGHWGLRAGGDAVGDRPSAPHIHPLNVCPSPRPHVTHQKRQN